MGLVLPSSHGADIETCRQLRQRRDRLASQAIEYEIAYVRTFRARICPQLAVLAEGSNARDQMYASIDYNAWNSCRREAERQLESTSTLFYRNRQKFNFYTAKGAALARQADEMVAELHAQQCPSLEDQSSPGT